MDSFSKDMMSNLLGNPHSASSSSQLSTRRIDDIRLRVLRFFDADPDLFDLVFTANATAGIKMVMEAFRENKQGFWFGYHMDSHTSLVGVREAAMAGHRCFMSDVEVEEWLESDQGRLDEAPQSGDLRLLAYPAQSNMNGRRLPLEWPTRLRSSRQGASTYSLLDAAALVSTSPLDLNEASQAADFTVLSFYKIFGFPDLGALIVRKESAPILQRRTYFGGGTVDMVACGKENWHVQKEGALHQQLEDGTLPIHSILALDSALNVHNTLFGSMELVASHAGFLANQLHQHLMAMRHYNDTKVCEVYKDRSSSYGDSKTQGPIVAFNLKDSRGEYVSNTEVEKLANIRNIQLRSGGLCNPGGSASALGLAAWELERNFSAGHRCGNENDLMGGKPTGMLRISFGAMSNLQDVETFVGFVQEFFIDRENLAQSDERRPSGTPGFYVESLTVFPIKSCGGWPVPMDIPWNVRHEGLAWDREWCIVHQGTRNALSQKRYPKMALLKPSIDLDKGLLRVNYHGFTSPTTPSEICVPLSATPNVFQNTSNGFAAPTSQVCGDGILAQIYASETVALFFTTAIGTPCTLARFPAATTGSSVRHSKFHKSTPGNEKMANHILFSNESPILTICRSSLNRLNEHIKQKDGKAAHASVFRANIVLAEDPALHPGLEQPYVEDEWKSLRIGENLMLDVLGGCRRCQMVCVDQVTAEKNEEPFVTLAKTRRSQGKVFFGVHTALSGEGERRRAAMIKIGDKVRAFTT